MNDEPEAKDDAAEEKGESMPKGGKWIQAAEDKMKKKGTVGAFGKATPKKISAAMHKGGLQKKRAVFANNMRKIAAKRKMGAHKSA